MTAATALWESQPASAPAGILSLARHAPTWAAAFLILLTLPPETSVRLGDLRISPYRWVLLFTLPAAAYALLTDAARRSAVDALVALHAACVVLAIAAVHDATKAASSGGIYVVESLGAYVLARHAVRTERDARALAAVLVAGVLVVMMLAIPEALSGRHLARDAARAVLGGTPPDEMGQRLGLTRAYGPFEHPILYGVYCAAAFSVAFATTGGPRGILASAATAVATFASVSSGAMAVVAIQAGLLAWDKFTRSLRGRWWILIALCASAIAAVSAVSTRSPIQVLITTVSLSPETGYMRIEIYNFGSEEVARHPWTGIGFNDWQRPDWMPDTGSVDNFWLLTAMRFGLPALLLLGAATALALWHAAKSVDSHDAAATLRRAQIFAVVGVVIAGCTVHFWNALFALFFFLLGSLHWNAKES